MDKKERAAYLLKQYLNNNITLKELQELTGLLQEEGNAEDLQAAFGSLIDQSTALPDYQETEWESLYRKIRKAGPGRKREIRRYWLAAAAIIIIFLSGGTILFLKNNRTKETPPTASRTHNSQHDISPGSNKAILTLADGSKIDLDEAKDGQIGQQGNARLVKLGGGQLAYRESREADRKNSQDGKKSGVPEISFNKISTPRGGQYQLILPDGTRVWLNAASSLTYPTAFSGKERSVELEGEAYFEVAKNAAMPFRVFITTQPLHAGERAKEPNSGLSPEHEGTQIEVLGTHFNVMAYTDEHIIKTTLLEGRVKVHSGDRAAMLAPGEQAKVSDKGMLTKAPADTDEAIAWKNGLFRFNEATIEEVMRQISRWYDVEVIYVNGAPKDLFRGEIYRNVNISKVLKVLEASGVHFTVEGKKILVQS